jgi:hypothetical protein
LRREWDNWTETSTGFDLRIGRRWENFTLGYKILSEMLNLKMLIYHQLKYRKEKKGKIV